MIDARVDCIIISANIQHIETNNTDRLSVIIPPKTRQLFAT